ncbi:MAG: hypothetical protein ACI3XI_00990 [Eubacteriales bacterium]
MTEIKRRIMTVGGCIVTAAAIALALLAFVAVNVSAVTGTAVPPASDLIPDGSDVTLPGMGDTTLPDNITGGDTNDVLTPDDTTRAPASTSTPDTTGDMAEDAGNGILGAVIAVIVVVAIILVVIALIPKKKQ